MGALYAARQAAGGWINMAGAEAFEAIRKTIGDEAFMYLEAGFNR